MPNAVWKQAIQMQMISCLLYGDAARVHEDSFKKVKDEHDTYSFMLARIP